MGPGRLTGMNVDTRWQARFALVRFNGARSIDRDERLRYLPRLQAEFGFNGARSIDRDERDANEARAILQSLGFNGARSIDRDERPRGVSAATQGT